MKKIWNVLTLSASLLSLILTSMALSSCGNSMYEVRESKDYRLTIRSSDPTILSGFDKLVQSFNSKAGIQALSMAPDAKSANSIILFTKGLTERDGKVGWGQWLVETKDETAVVAVTGRKPVRELDYSLRVELDLDYVQQRVSSTETDKQYDLFKLFCHEIGHGFQLAHNDMDQSDMMFPDIGGTKDEARFFEQVRTFFAQ